MAAPTHLNLLRRGQSHQNVGLLSLPDDGWASWESRAASPEPPPLPASDMLDH
ncbi:uncharacterized protein LACBIDRAFT_316320 [Laccaria bicolor S238N-H82]|uniref:Predicted protein n=1 Tax=Laccaria bicolor (strain S238N-H82 / ATCC MYA-4686) TaxID=486041 RepID=B0E0P8_LACBS|nr:uncharacterized protein LACBIDRAFT_316320 [Laccaria bicolor S238N-H82]EDQ99566.1 predicted protein [Laccaria bicolor S238N-H82]|eukprot:XP_001889790.1 predicted protein [Laccaria bicolor S238N-H82]